MPSCSVLSSRYFPGAIAVACALAPTDAAAHAPIPGLMGFYVGMLHPLSTPPQFLALFALGLMLGQQFPRDFLVCWIVFAICCFAGMLLGQTVGMQGTENAWLLAICLIAALLAALLPNGLFLPWLVLTGGAGLLVGVLSTPDPGHWRATLISLVGSFVGANLALLFSTGGVGWLTERFTQHWVRIGFRIIAAWIAAISFLMLALVVSGASDTKQISPSADAQSMILERPLMRPVARAIQAGRLPCGRSLACGPRRDKLRGA